MRQLFMRALNVSALAVALALTAHAQTPAPSPALGAQATAPIEDVRRELQAQRAEIEQLRATVAEQTRLLQQLLAREAKTSTPAAIKDASYSTADVATPDTLAGARDGVVSVDAGQAAANKTAQAPSAPRPTEINTAALSSLMAIVLANRGSSNNPVATTSPKTSPKASPKTSASPSAGWANPRKSPTWRSISAPPKRLL